MSTTRVARRFQFCAGHRIYGHESKCNWLHGHNYVALVVAAVDHLDRLTRVVDFGVLKARYGEWIEANWDHKLILSANDPLLETYGLLHAGYPMEKVWVMPKGQPTAEGMAEHLLRLGPELLREGLGLFEPGQGVRVVRVRLWETENCYAEVSEGRGEE